MGHAASGIRMTLPYKPRVLVVDDDAFQHKIVDMVLGNTHYHLSFACSGEEAIAMLEHTRADLILMDVQMPGIGGLEATRRLKSMPHLIHIPILMASGEGDDQVVAQCLQAGAVDFVFKPFDRATLPAKVSLLSSNAGAVSEHPAGGPRDGA